MKTWICILATCAALGAAERSGAAAGKPAVKKAAAKESPARPASDALPAGAVKVEEGTWHYTDPEGRKWVYRKTPWGMARFEENQPKPAAPKAEERIAAFDEGDWVRFERPGPFGIYKYRQKKSKLSGAEKEAWERARETSAAREARERK